MRIVLADPPAFTPPYDHALSAALAAAGADVELVTAPFRFGARPEPRGYRRRDLFYPLSGRVRQRGPRLALRVVEHPLGMIALQRRRADVLHLQWLALPEVDRVLLRTKRPLVFTAHDLLPRRTAAKRGLWRALFARFERIVVHSQRGRSVLMEAGVPAGAVRVIPHPVFRTDVLRRDDGRTVLALGVIRPYKGLGDAVSSTMQTSRGRLLVVGDPRIPVAGLQASAGTRAEWRLGFQSDEAIEQALGEATVAVFPYRAELDQSGALLQALGAGVPAVAYDVGGLGEVINAFGAGIVVPPGDTDGLARALDRLLDEPETLAAARAGAERARLELTWEASARAHLALYEELV